MEMICGTRQFLLLHILYSLLHQDVATRCFECQNIPYPRACSKLVDCNSDEHCFTEQYVTTSGSIVYSTGCLPRQRCTIVSGQNFGSTFSNISVRSNTDISTCVECCAGDFCNNQGCGTKAVPFDQRGPYCFHCDAVLDPTACSNAAVCLQNEVCLLYSPSDFAGLPETIFRSSCARQSKCDELLRTDGRTDCTPYCCKTDFCNDKCGILRNLTSTYIIPTHSSPKTTKEVSPTSTSSTTTPTTTTTATTTTTTKKPTCTVPHHNNHNHCEGDGYFLLRTDKHSTRLCVHFVKNHSTWDAARKICKHEGGDLVVLDDHHKANLIRHYLEKSIYNHSSFWIGARDFEETRQFSWVDCKELINTRADWDSTQPSFSSHVARVCVGINNPNFKWHNRNCSNVIKSICERKLY
ncbi:uncharacterized protein LOC132720220 [Ruditapes philippinarum]|uniref:uncharacterized protein LOC132720220 n=1 Tax=Ruditapes philippinarum TaxID=129788 RepID=UPI00295B54B9|nr:uncharacterized protein LOC132720220 [Ruditapes philippinarum]